MQAMSLAAEDGTVENNDMRNLVQQLEANSALVGALSRQLQVGVGHRHGNIGGNFSSPQTLPKLFWTFLKANSQHEFIHCVAEFNTSLTSLFIP